MIRGLEESWLEEGTRNDDFADRAQKHIAQALAYALDLLLSASHLSDCCYLCVRVCPYVRIRVCLYVRIRVCVCMCVARHAVTCLVTLHSGIAVFCRRYGLKRLESILRGARTTLRLHLYDLSK